MKFVFLRPQLGTTYGVHNADEGTTVELDESFAADAVASGLLAPVEDSAPAPVKGKPGRPRKAE